MMHFKSILCIFVAIVSIVGQTIVIDVSKSFGTRESNKTMEKLPLDSGNAYHFRTKAAGIELRSSKLSPTIHDCFYAMRIPDDPDFSFLTIYLESLEAAFSNYENSTLTLKFLSVSKPKETLTEIVLTPHTTRIQNEYVNTHFWPTNIKWIHLSLEHSLSSDSNQSCVIRLQITVTPTYICQMAKGYPLGSFLSFRNSQNFNLFKIREIFTSGYFLCTDSWIPFSLQQNEIIFYSAFCINYRLTCDGRINCPNNNRFPYNTRSQTYRALQNSDENVGFSVCFSSSTNWIIIVIIIFTVINIFLLLIISYLGIVRRYLPIHFFRLQAHYLRCCCCCLPRRWRGYLAGNSSFNEPTHYGDRISSTSSDLPRSPPTYDRVSNVGGEEPPRRFWQIWHKKCNSGNMAESQHHLPPSYTEAPDEEIGVYPEQIIKTIHGQYRLSSKFFDSGFAIFPKHNAASAPIISQPGAPRMNTREFLRMISRHVISCCCSTSYSCLRLCNFHRLPRHAVEVHPEQAAGEEESQTLPNYANVLGGDFSGTLYAPNAPETEEVGLSADYISGHKEQGRPNI